MFNVYLEGEKGYHEGACNPYRGGTKEAAQWACGYRSARGSDKLYSNKAVNTSPNKVKTK